MALVATFTLAGCGQEPDYQLLQDAMTEHITSTDHRPVSSVACTPHINGTVREETAHLQCLVRFKDGTSYTANAIIQNENFGGAHNLPDSYSWDMPPPAVDITRVMPPRPAGATARIGPTSRSSLFYARNLSPILTALTRRFGASRSVLVLVLYPGELKAVIGDNGEARLVTATTTGPLAIGPSTRFEGPRDAVNISQLTADVPERLARLIAAQGGVPTSRLDRFVLNLSLPGNLAGWDIYPRSGSPRFEALLTGDSLQRISASGKQTLN